MTQRRFRLFIIAAVVVVLGVVAYYSVSVFAKPSSPRSATLHFTCDDASVLAEILLLDGDAPLRPAFRVKGSEPLRMPAGSYRLRLSSPGWMSETLLVDAIEGRDEPIAVQLNDSPLWPPLEMSDGGEVIELDEGRSDVIKFTKTGVQRWNGARLKKMWSVELDTDDPKRRPAPLIMAGLRWRDFLPPAGDYWPRLAQSAADLNGDGYKDLLWLSRSTPALFAQSGLDGSVLWAYCGDENRVPATVAENAALVAGSVLLGRCADPGQVVGNPVRFDLDGEGVPVLFVTFRNSTRCWLEAIASNTGQRLWRFELEPEWYNSGYQCELAPQTFNTFHFARFPVAVAKRNGKAIVSLVAVGTLVELDARTGERLGEPLALDQLRPGQADANSGVTFAGKPRVAAVWSTQFVDLDGDGVDELLILRWSKARNFDLIALSLATRQPLWQTTLRESPAWWYAEPDWPHVYHESDGSTTVLVHNGSTAQSVILEAFDGATGNSRWKRSLSIDPKAAGPSQRLDRFLPGPDLDGDGRRDIFVATLGIPHKHSGQPHYYLFVDALSGKDGKTLWTTRLRQPGALFQEKDKPREVRPMAWWQTGGDGWPQLLVPIRCAVWDTTTDPVTYVLSAGTGRVVNVLPRIADARLADLDGDGVLDLYWFTPEKTARVLDTARGGLPEAWRRFGVWRPVDDLDGDGVTDYVRVDAGKTTTLAISGRDGRLLGERDAAIIPPERLPLEDVSKSRQWLVRLADDAAGLASTSSENNGSLHRLRVTDVDAKLRWEWTTTEPCELVDVGAAHRNGPSMLIVKMDEGFYGVAATDGSVEWRTKRRPTLVSSSNDEPARLIYQTENPVATVCQIVSLAPARGPIRIDAPAQTLPEWFAKGVARYHLDWAAFVVLIALLLAALVKRSWLSWTLVLLVLAAAYAVLWSLARTMTPSDIDPRLVDDADVAGLGSQAATLAAAVLLAGLIMLSLWRLMRVSFNSPHR